MDINPPKAEIPVTVIMEGEFVAENLATLEGNVKEDVLAYLNSIEMKQQDVLVLLVAGQDVFIQPYKGDYITSTLPSDKQSNDDDSSNDQASEFPKSKPAFLTSHGGENQ